MKHNPKSSRPARQGAHWVRGEKYSPLSSRVKVWRLTKALRRMNVK